MASYWAGDMSENYRQLGKWVRLGQIQACWILIMKFSDFEPIKDKAVVANGISRLDEWYRRIRDVDLSEMELSDLCRAIRQKLFLSHTMIYATNILLKNIYAGDDYDGQLLVSISALDSLDWKQIPLLALRVKKELLERMPLSVADLQMEACNILKAIG